MKKSLHLKPIVGVDFCVILPTAGFPGTPCSIKGHAMIKKLRFLSSVMVVCFFCPLTEVSADAEELLLPKGHVVDFLLLTRKENISEVRSRYFEDLYPPAKALGYEPVAGFRTSRKPISGYYSPDVLAIGTWPGDWQKRKSLFSELVAIEPEIRSRRLDIWSTFNMLNVELEEDVTIRLEPNKTYVFGSYWLDDDRRQAELKKSRLTAIDQSGGSVQFVSDDVKTMFGYTDPPDLVMIVEWNSQKEFEQFNQQHGAEHGPAVRVANEVFLDINPAEGS